jgi:hypothetical protein
VIFELIHKIFGKNNEPDDNRGNIVSEQNIESYNWLIKKIQEYSLSVLLGKSRAVNIIGIHCSESKSDDILNLDDAELFFKNKLGKKNIYSNGYIPYHFIITKNGDILETMPLSAPAIAFSGHINDGISICYIGFENKTKEQQESLDFLISSLKDNLSIRTVINA